MHPISLLVLQVSDKVWSIVAANSDFKVNENLSSTFIVPTELIKTAKESDLKKKLKSSLLTLSWMHPGSKSYLVRLDTVQTAKGKGKSKKDESDGEAEEAAQLQCFLKSLGPGKDRKKVYLLDTAGPPLALQLKKPHIAEKVCTFCALSFHQGLHIEISLLDDYYDCSFHALEARQTGSSGMARCGWRWKRQRVRQQHQQPYSHKGRCGRRGGSI